MPKIFRRFAPNRLGFVYYFAKSPQKRSGFFYSSGVYSQYPGSGNTPLMLAVLGSNFEAVSELHLCDSNENTDLKEKCECQYSE